MNVTPEADLLRVCMLVQIKRGARGHGKTRVCIAFYAGLAGFDGIDVLL